MSGLQHDPLDGVPIGAETNIEVVSWGCVRSEDLTPPEKTFPMLFDNGIKIGDSNAARFCGSGIAVPKPRLK